MKTRFEIFPWNDNFKVDIPIIDTQHKKLVSLVNDVAELIAHKEESDQIETIFIELNDYASHHFNTEEEIWQQYLSGDALQANHHRAHAEFLERLNQIRSEKNSLGLSDQYRKILSFLTNWLVFHILESDRQLARICLAMQHGASLQEARISADQDRSDSRRILTDALLSMTHDLSDLSFQLSSEIEQRKSVQLSLTRALNFSRSLINSMQDGFLMLDRFGSIAEVNPAFCRMTGYTPKELVGSCPPFPFWAKEVEEKMKHVFQRALMEKSTECESLITRKTGDSMAVLVSVYQLDHDSATDEESINALAFTVKDITERKVIEEKQRQLSFYDPLTNLANRRLFYDRLSQAMEESLRTSRCFAIVFIDLDRFKTLNDTKGHIIGDLLLKEVAKRIRECVRAIDTVSRFGGDEFVVLLSNLNPDDSQKYAEQVAHKLRVKLSEPHHLPLAEAGAPQQTFEYQCTASIGVTLSRGHEHDKEALLSQADKAMYQAKELGRNTVCFYKE